MPPAPHEQGRQPVSYAAGVARRRQARDPELKLPEATALVTDHVLEGARLVAPVDPRAYASTMRIGEAAAAVGEAAVRLPLTGGSVTTGCGGALHTVAAEVAGLGPCALEATA